MREHLRVCVGFESVSSGEKFVFERVVIFNDAVVNDGDFTGLVKMWMTIFVGRNPMRRPARMSDADISRDGFGLQNLCKTFADFPSFFTDGQRAAIRHGDARAVITAIFQPPQAFQQDGRGRFFSRRIR